MITIRQELASDTDAREALLDEAYGPSRFRKPSEAIRRGRRPAEGLALVAIDAQGSAPDGALDRMVGTVRLWPVSAGGRPALLLGPLAVACGRQCQGIGAALVECAIETARARGHAAIVLVGDAPYYGRFGFTNERTSALAMPGPFEPHRLLGLELVPGGLAGAAGVIAPAGRPVTKPRRRAA